MRFDVCRNVLSVLGAIAEDVQKRTLSSAGRGRGAQRPEPLARLVDIAPEVVAREADVLPAERGDVGEEVIGDIGALVTEVVHGAAEVGGVPEDDGGGDQVQPRGAVPLGSRRFGRAARPSGQPLR